MSGECDKCGDHALECGCDAHEIFPCPFCAWKNIRIIEDEIKEKDHVFKGSKYTFCWCKVCGTCGPWAYSVDDDEKTVIRKCIERWNERHNLERHRPVPYQN
jgi:hypothetical protein